MGFANVDYQQWLTHFKYAATPEGLKAIEEFELVMKDITFEWIPYVDFASYPSTLINMSLDIGICPIKDTSFNKARSASKAMEYTLSGALALASDIGPYREDPTSVLVKDNEWEQALESYIHFPEKRKELHSQHLEWIKNNRNIQSPEIIDLLKGVYIV